MQYESWHTEERRYGRRERREYWLVVSVEGRFARQVDAWPNLGAVDFVRRWWQVGESEREQVSFDPSEARGQALCARGAHLLSD